MTMQKNHVEFLVPHRRERHHLVIEFDDGNKHSDKQSALQK